MIATSLNRKKHIIFSICITLTVSIIAQYIAIREQFAIFMPGYSGVGIEPVLFTVINGVLFPFLWLINYANTVMIHRLLKIASGKKEIFLSFIIPFISIFIYLALPFIFSAYSSYHEKSVKNNFNIELSYPSVDIHSNGSCRFSWEVTNNSKDIAENAEINFSLSVKIPNVEEDTVYFCATNMRLHQDLNPGINVIKGIAEPSHYNNRKFKNEIKDLPILIRGYVRAENVTFDYSENLSNSVKDQILNNLDTWFMPRY